MVSRGSWSLVQRLILCPVDRRKQVKGLGRVRRAKVSKGAWGRLEKGSRQVHPLSHQEDACASWQTPWDGDGAGIQAGTWKPWHNALPSRVLRPQQGSMPPCLPVQEGPPNPAQPEGGREAMVSGSCPALPWGLGSWKGYWEEPWAPSHHSPGSWLWRERLTPRGVARPAQPEGQASACAPVVGRGLG